MSDVIQIGGHSRGLGANARSDRWWVAPLVQGLGFLAFVVYANTIAYLGVHYFYAAGAHGFGGYLSPFYSPLLFTDPSLAGSAPLTHAWLGEWPGWLAKIWPPFLPHSPAWLILIGPLSFRATCYYYRKFYYRSYFLSPPACAVGGAREGKYNGENKFFLFQNIHRYTFYIAAAYIVILSWDAIQAFWRGGQFGIGVGTIVLCINPLLLAFYTFGCHSCRHLAGGRVNWFSRDKGKYRVWSTLSKLNAHHMFWAWVSMIWVGFTDFYIRMVSMGVWPDLNTWGN